MLNQYQKWYAEYLNLAMQRNMILYDEAVPPAIDYSKDKVMVTPEDRMPGMMDRIARRTRNIDRRMDYLEKKMDRCIDLINMMPVPNHSKLLFERYVLGFTWHEISCSMHMDLDYVRGHLHTRAVEEFKKITTEYSRRS